MTDDDNVIIAQPWFTKTRRRQLNEGVGYASTLIALGNVDGRHKTGCARGQLALFKV